MKIPSLYIPMAILYYFKDITCFYPGDYVSSLNQLSIQNSIGKYTYIYSHNYSFWVQTWNNFTVISKMRIDKFYIHVI